VIVKVLESFPCGERSGKMYTLRTKYVSSTDDLEMTNALKQSAEKMRMYDLGRNLKYDTLATGQAVKTGIKIVNDGCDS
jgi:hypothetical protein